jgi:hypothetical protein
LIFALSPPPFFFIFSSDCADPLRARGALPQMRKENQGVRACCVQMVKCKPLDAQIFLLQFFSFENYETRIMVPGK